MSNKFQIITFQNKEMNCGGKNTVKRIRLKQLCYQLGSLANWLTSLDNGILIRELQNQGHLLVRAPPFCDVCFLLPRLAFSLFYGLSYILVCVIIMHEVDYPLHA